MARDEFRVIIAGGRNFARMPSDREDVDLLTKTMDNLLQYKKRSHRIVVLWGMAKGRDMAGKRYAEQCRFHVRYFPADWQQYGRRAGIVRNELMVQNADALVAFWDGSSPGTKNMIETAQRYGLAVRVIRYNHKSEMPEKDEFGFPIIK